MKPHTISITCVALVFAISIARLCHVSEAAGFTIDLIHRDSLESPLLDLLSSIRVIQNDLQRSFNRFNLLTQRYSQKLGPADIIADGGSYLLRYSVGTPPVEALAVADTGSDLTWLQCKPCEDCFNQTAPLFDPTHSSTYKSVQCFTEACDAVQRNSCDFSKGTCRYTIRYGDSSFSIGDVATDTLTLGSAATNNTASFPDIIIGCGHRDKGTFGKNSEGIVGLGGGKTSLITQLDSSIQGKFSYCLVPSRGKTSKMAFGDQAIVSGPDVVSTPIVPKTPETFYFLTLEGITVGNERLNAVIGDSKVEDKEGNMIIDSGTTLTFLPSPLYNQVETAVKGQTKMKQIQDPAGQLKLCFSSLGNDADVPEITVHFSGADLKLKPVNSFVKTGPLSLCLAYAPSTTFGIYGNLAQINFLVGYDTVKKTVSFKPTDCSKA